MVKDRIDQMDSIRGLAAIAVVFCHFYSVEINPYLSSLLFKYSPFTFLINGHGSVIMFFLLSGFVLMLPFLKGAQTTYKTFLVKRILRIYIPFWIAMLFAFLMYALLSAKKVSGLSEWFYNSWNGSITLKSIVENLFLIGNFNSNLYNNAIWSLIHEMRISLIFPFIAFIVIKLSWKKVLSIALSLSVISGTTHVFSFDVSYGYHTGFVDTFHYASIFLIGGLLAKHRGEIVNWFAQSSTKYKWVIVAAAYVLFTYAGFAMAVGNLLGLYSYSEILADYTATAGASLIIVVALGSAKVATILSKPVFKFFGNISYSLYLYHLIVLYSFVYLLHGIVPMSIIYVITFLLTVLISVLSYKYIEIPTIKLGKKMTMKEQPLTFRKEAVTKPVMKL